MSIEEADTEVTTPPVDSTPNKTPDSRKEQQDLVNEKDKSDSPPRSPDKEKGDAEKEVKLDLLATSEVNLHDGPSDEHRHNEGMAKFSIRILSLLLGQMTLLCLCAVISHAVNGTSNYFSETNVALGYMGLFCLLAATSMTSDIFYEPTSSSIVTKKRRYLDAGFLAVQTVAWMIVSYCFTAAFSHVVFLGMFLAPMFSYALILFFIFIRKQNVMSAPTWMKFCIFGSTAAQFIPLMLSKGHFGDGPTLTDPNAILIGGLLGFALSAAVAQKVHRLARNRLYEHIAEIDFGLSTIVFIYRSFFIDFYEYYIESEAVAQE